MPRYLSEVSAPRLFRYIGYRLILVIHRLLFLSPLQCLLLRICGARLGTNVVMETPSFYNLYVAGLRHFRVGDDVYIGPECIFDLSNPVTIGNQVTLAARVNVATHLHVGFRDHPLQARFPRRDAGVTVCDGSFIGTGSILLPGISVGRHSFIAAGSVVTESTAENSVSGGVPARVISSRGGTP